MKENGAETNALDAYKPWSVSSTIDYLTSVGKGYDTGIGIDAHFIAQANESSIPILELESLEYQLDMFDNFSAELQEEMLQASIESYFSEEIALDMLSEMWITGDEEQLLQLIKDTATNEEMNKAMLLDRNAPMVEKIKGYLNEKEPKTYFVVVGALHMLGTDGLVPLLEKEGFTVTRQ
ncbi:TraB family protein [compost metagenome]